MEWIKIKTQADIDFLLGEYFGFHDASIFSVGYKKDFHKDEAGRIWTGIDTELFITFRTSIAAFCGFPKKEFIELRFHEPKRFNFMGSGDIYSGYLAFYQNYIVWADDWRFDPAAFRGEGLLCDNMTLIPAFVVAKELSWRFLDKDEAAKIVPVIRH